MMAGHTHHIVWARKANVVYFTRDKHSALHIADLAERCDMKPILKLAPDKESDRETVLADPALLQAVGPISQSQESPLSADRVVR